MKEKRGKKVDQNMGIQKLETVKYNFNYPDEESIKVFKFPEGEFTPNPDYPEEVDTGTFDFDDYFEFLEEQMESLPPRKWKKKNEEPIDSSHFVFKKWGVTTIEEFLEKKKERDDKRAKKFEIQSRTGRWISVILHNLIKDGKLIKAWNILSKILKEIHLKFNINVFFEKIETQLHLPIALYNRRVAGKKMLIPRLRKDENEIFYMVKWIFKNVRLRSEKKIYDRLLNELIDVFNNKGNTIKKHKEMCNDIKASVPNLRFLR